CLQGYSTPLTF
nr:immunoglobulin light chain junction region [Macaca mulatta]MOV34302.1 immunoglobulin light chain junction region [Macaca mulatta]MOW08007.1 immunoglobulin light chain junction region [Macaca mulatta]MOW08986.1 immunoglobulin light chain junction region [Macaca mulatta]MOW09874.1 immunoglobulin light chain junction region [Macaca mulatta]